MSSEDNDRVLQKIAAGVLMGRVISSLGDAFEAMPPDAVLKVIVAMIDGGERQMTDMERPFYQIVRSLCVIGLSFNQTYKKGFAAVEAVNAELAELDRAKADAGVVEPDEHDQEMLKLFREAWNTWESGANSDATN